jgi:RNA polymerase sigma-70 factor (ECF subfamily)
MSPPRDLASTETDFPQDTDAALVAAAHRRPAAFAALYDRYVASVYRYHLSRVGDVAEAEDLTAQTFLAALEAFPRYRHRGRFAPWLFKIARSKAMDHLRRKRSETPIESIALQSSEPDPELSSQAEESRRRLLDVLEKLPPDDLELIRLRYVVELSFRDMADMLGRNTDAVKKALYRLQASLKRKLEQPDE